MKKTLISLTGVLIGLLIIGAVVYTGVFSEPVNGAHAQTIMDNTSIADDNQANIDLAKDKIKKFSGKSDEKVSFKQKMTAPHGDYYEMRSDDAIYYVDINTGEVDGATYLNTVSTGNNSTNKLSQNQAESIARDFIEKHDSKFSTIENMSLIKADLVDHGTAGSEYEFVWGQTLNGILTPNATRVCIDSATGEVISYACIKKSTKVKLESKIPNNQAITKAAGQFNNIIVTNSEASLKIFYKHDGSQTVAWVVHIIGQPINRIDQGGEVVIDANTGEIISTYSF